MARLPKQLGLIIIAILIGGLLLSACSSGAAPAPAASDKAKDAQPAAKQDTSAPPQKEAPAAKDSAAKPASNEPIKVGVVAPWTGRYAPMGEGVKKGIDFATEKVNAAGGINGRKLEMIFYDDEADQAKATQLTNKAIQQDKVPAVIGSYVTANSQVVADIAEKSKVINLYMGPSEAIGRGKKYVFHVNADVFVEAEAQLEYIQKKLGKSSIGILYDENPYGVESSAATKQVAEKRGMKVVAMEKYGGSDTDVTPQLTKIKNAAPDALVICGTLPTPAIAIKQMKQLGISIPFVGGSGMATPQFVEVAGDAAEGATAVTSLRYTDPPAWQSKFLADYKAKYKADPSYFDALGYDSVTILAAGIAKAGGKLDSDSVAKGIESLQKYESAIGIRSFTPTDHNGLTLDSQFMMAVKGGKWTDLPK